MQTMVWSSKRTISLTFTDRSRYERFMGAGTPFCSTFVSFPGNELAMEPGRRGRKVKRGRTCVYRQSIHPLSVAQRGAAL